MNLFVGQNVYIEEHKRPFKIKACTERYAICTKPCNLRHSVLYFILDLQEMERGPDNQVFCSGYITQQDCEERLQELVNGEIEISQRNKVKFNSMTQINKNLYLSYKTT